MAPEPRSPQAIDLTGRGGRIRTGDPRLPKAFTKDGFNGEKDIAELLGHSDTRSTKIYVEITDKRKREAIESIEYEGLSYETCYFTLLTL